MQTARGDGRRFERLSGTLAVLSAAVVAMALFAIASIVEPEALLTPAVLLPAAAINIGIVAALAWGLAYYRGRLVAADKAIRLERRARGEAGRQRDSAATLVDSDTATIVMTEPGRAPRLVNAGTTPGLPRDLVQLLDWQIWLPAETAHLVAFQMQQLLADGRAFTSAATTLMGSRVEFDGRGSAAGAVLRIRDVTARVGDAAELQRRAQRLQREAKLWRGIGDALPMPVWLRGPDNRIDWVNNAYVKAVDALSREDVRMRQVEWLDETARHTAEQRASDGRAHRERMLVRQGNERRSFDVTLTSLAGSGGEQARAGFGMEASRGKAGGLDDRGATGIDPTFDRVATAIAIFGPDQRLDFVNPAFRALWRLEPGWLAARPRFGELLDRLRETRQLPEEAEYHAWKQQQLRTVNERIEIADSWHLPTGRAVNVRSLPRADGGVTCLYDDVSEQLGLESRLNALLHVQGETLDHLKEGVAVFGTDGRLRLFNSAFAGIWKLNPDDLAREPHVEEVLLRCRVLYSHDETWHAINRAVTGMVDQRQRIEGTMTRPDASVIAYAGLPLPDGAQLLTFVDVTDATRAERMLIERNEALETADRLKDQFVSSVSYNLRVPLQSIIGFSDLLSSPVFGPLNAKQREYVEDIATSSNTLLAIINDILDLATIDAGALELKLVPISVEAVIRAAAAGVAERVARAKLELIINIDPDVSEVVADEHRLKQVLFNLLANATSHSDDGDRVALVCRREAGRIVFEVEDEGAGISHDQQRTVFDRFIGRAQGSRQRGAGLGLAMVKSLVELHGGDVSLASEPGQGTRVTIRLPERASRGLPQRRPASPARGSRDVA